MIDSQRLERTIHSIGLLLAQGRYAELKARDRGSRLTVDSITERVQEYGRVIVPFPPGEPARVDVQEIERSQPQRWSVLIPLWTAEEGESDLTLVTTMIDEPDASGCYGVELDDLRVL